MAELTILGKFVASHGTGEIVQSIFHVTVSIRGPITGSFVEGLDFVEAQQLIEGAIYDLNEKYLDDIVGRATIENIACFLLFALKQIRPYSVSVTNPQSISTKVTAEDMVLNDYASLLHYKRGASLLVRHRYSEALQELSQALAGDPNLIAAIVCRGRCYRRLGQLSNALSEFTTAVRAAPQCGEAWRNLANAYLDSGLHDKMMAAFDRAIQLMPRSPVAWNNRGYARQKLHQFKEAIDDHSKAIQLDPTYAEAFADRAQAYSAMLISDKAGEDLSAMRLLQIKEDPVRREWPKTECTTEVK